MSDSETPEQSARRQDGYSHVVCVGRLTADPEQRSTSAGTVTNFRLAVNEGPEPSFFDVVLWEQPARFAAEWLKRGARVLVEGRLRQRRWEREGTAHERVEIVVRERLIALGGGRREEGAVESGSEAGDG